MRRALRHQHHHQFPCAIVAFGAALGTPAANTVCTCTSRNNTRAAAAAASTTPSTTPTNNNVTASGLVAGFHHHQRRYASSSWRCTSCAMTNDGDDSGTTDGSSGSDCCFACGALRKKIKDTQQTPLHAQHSNSTRKGGKGITSEQQPSVVAAAERSGEDSNNRRKRAIAKKAKGEEGEEEEEEILSKANTKANMTANVNLHRNNNSNHNNVHQTPQPPLPQAATSAAAASPAANNKKTVLASPHSMRLFLMQHRLQMLLHLNNNNSDNNNSGAYTMMKAAAAAGATRTTVPPPPPVDPLLLSEEVREYQNANNSTTTTATTTPNDEKTAAADSEVEVDLEALNAAALDQLLAAFDGSTDSPYGDTTTCINNNLHHHYYYQQQQQLLQPQGHLEQQQQQSDRNSRSSDQDQQRQRQYYARQIDLLLLRGRNFVNNHQNNYFAAPFADVLGCRALDSGWSVSRNAARTCAAAAAQQIAADAAAAEAEASTITTTHTTANSTSPISLASLIDEYYNNGSGSSTNTNGTNNDDDEIPQQQSSNNINNNSSSSSGGGRQQPQQQRPYQNDIRAQVAATVPAALTAVVLPTDACTANYSVLRPVIGITTHAAASAHNNNNNSSSGGTTGNNNKDRDSGPLLIPLMCLPAHYSAFFHLRRGGVVVAGSGSGSNGSGGPFVWALTVADLRARTWGRRLLQLERLALLPSYPPALVHLVAYSCSSHREEGQNSMNESNRNYYDDHENTSNSRQRPVPFARQVSDSAVLSPLRLLLLEGLARVSAARRVALFAIVSHMLPLLLKHAQQHQQQKQDVGKLKTRKNSNVDATISSAYQKLSRAEQRLLKAILRACVETFAHAAWAKKMKAATPQQQPDQHTPPPTTMHSDILSVRLMASLRLSTAADRRATSWRHFSRRLAASRSNNKKKRSAATVISPLHEMKLYSWAVRRGRTAPLSRKLRATPPDEVVESRRCAYCHFLNDKKNIKDSEEGGSDRCFACGRSAQEGASDAHARYCRLRAVGEEENWRWPDDGSSNSNTSTTSGSVHNQATPPPTILTYAFFEQQDQQRLDDQQDDGQRFAALHREQYIHDLFSSTASAALASPQHPAIPDPTATTTAATVFGEAAFWGQQTQQQQPREFGRYDDDSGSGGRWQGGERSNNNNHTHISHHTQSPPRRLSDRRAEMARQHRLQEHLQHSSAGDADPHHNHNGGYVDHPRSLSNKASFFHQRSRNSTQVGTSTTTTTAISTAYRPPTLTTSQHNHPEHHYHHDDNANDHQHHHYDHEIQQQQQTGEPYASMTPLGRALFSADYNDH